MLSGKLTGMGRSPKRYGEASVFGGTKAESAWLGGTNSFNGGKITGTRRFNTQGVLALKLGNFCNCHKCVLDWVMQTYHAYAFP